jgi:hypothetical protein
VPQTFFGLGGPDAALSVWVAGQQEVHVSTMRYRGVQAVWWILGVGVATQKVGGEAALNCGKFEVAGAQDEGAGIHTSSDTGHGVSSDFGEQRRWPRTFRR